MWPCIVTNFFVTEPTSCTNFTNLFCHETLHVSDSSSVHHQEFIHCTLSNGICHTVEQDRDGASWSCSTAVYKPVCHIPLLSVQWINSWWTDELSETCRVSWQNKFVKLVHLAGFITEKKSSFRITCSFQKIQQYTKSRNELTVRILVTFTTNTITVSYLWLTTKLNSNQILMSTT